MGVEDGQRLPRAKRPSRRRVLTLLLAGGVFASVLGSCGGKRPPGGFKFPGTDKMAGSGSG